jgi:serine/threonine protein kinase
LAKIYGGRYENLNQPMGGGSQADVLRVRDAVDPAHPEYALKRLKRADRCARFKSEIEALRIINHPNVIKIIDHSGDPAPGETGHKYWFVMPIASGNLEDRVALYKGDLDAVLQVAIQLADALAAAHALSIVHRDVKPGNILFPRLDHEVWLSDFGICHLGAAKERLTEGGEVVGPRGFTAPELEAGGPVPVTPAADLYSLGKVIYYMLSGGGIVAREELDSPDYVATFAKGERYALLRTLLFRMIAPLDRRIKAASELREELRRIEKWEEHARSLALSPAALASIDAAQRKAADQVRIKDENERIRKNERDLVNSVTANILTWLKGELEKTASVLEKGGTHEVEIGKATWDSDRRFGFDYGHTEKYLAIDGLQLAFVNTAATFKSKFVLKFFICQVWRPSFQVGDNAHPIKATDPQLALVPYIVELQAPEYTKWFLGGFLQSESALAKSDADFAMRMGRRYVRSPRSLIARTFIGSPITLLVNFRASEWPGKLDAVKEMFSESVKIVVDFSNTPNRSTEA